MVMAGKDFKCPCCGQDLTDPRLESRVRQIEEEVGEELTVTSGYRCKKHNEEVGGSPTSSHMKGLAVDLACGNSRLRYRVVGAAIRLGVTRIGIGKNYIHLDIDRQKAPRVIWLY
jgi:uncharacterized protein YcbK (DUF882 family)